MRRAVLEIVSSVDVRTAIARQTTGFAEELATDARADTRRLDGAVEHFVSRRVRAKPTEFGGVASRGLALAIDSFIVVLLYASLSAMASLIASLVGELRPAWLVGLLLAVGWAVLAGGYFVFFWRLAGRTPGMHLMHLHVRDGRGQGPVVLALRRPRRRARRVDRDRVPRLRPGAVHRAAARAARPRRRNGRRLRLTTSGAPSRDGARSRRGTCR